jgi:hypothetical protein
MTKSLHSSFWLDDDSISTLESTKKLDTIELAKYQRVISNFVRILTKQSIPVEYRSGSDSYTDSKTVVIGSSIDSKKFDSVVGLALHEASHIKLTDFSVMVGIMTKLTELGYDEEMKQLCSDYVTTLKTLVNLIEDRRIDYYVYTNSPGYKGYYQSLYDRYFNDPIVDKGLRSTEYRTLTMDSYMFRMINFTNPNTDLDALPRLREIYQLIFSNVPTVKNTTQTLDIAVQVLMIVLDVLDTESDDNGEDEQSEQSDSGDGEGSSSTNDEDGNETEEQYGNKSSDSQSNDTKDLEELTERQKGLLPKKIERQRKFLEGNVQKGRLNKQEKAEVEMFAKNHAEIKEVEYESYYGSSRKQNVVVLRGMTPSNMNVIRSVQDNAERFNRDSVWASQQCEERRKIVTDGVMLGKRLGRKLQIRNRERITELTRRKKGKVERRRLYALGADDYNVFNQIHIDKYNDAFLHLSIDGSDSMSGKPFDNSLLSAVAIAQMSSMTNLDIQISIRYTGNISGKEVPIMWVVYDSRTDKLQSFLKKAHYLESNGTTPEGLCFASIVKELPTGSDALETYFINYSDGMPWFQDYDGQQAIEHTRQQVLKMKSLGYKVLSFFVTDYNRDDTSNDFRRMYGSDAKMIDVTSLTGLAKQLQKMFINKNDK